MTPIRETIARAISVGHAHGEPDMPWHPQGSNREDALPLWQWFQVDAAAVLRALDEAGLVVVPKEAGEAMLTAAGDAFLSAVVDHVPGDMPGANTPFRRIYRAMIAAAPSTAPDVVG